MCSHDVPHHGHGCVCFDSVRFVMKLGHSVAEVGQGRLQECDHRGVVSNGGGGGGGV